MSYWVVRRPFRPMIMLPAELAEILVRKKDLKRIERSFDRLRLERCNIPCKVCLIWLLDLMN